MKNLGTQAEKGWKSRQTPLPLPSFSPCGCYLFALTTGSYELSEEALRRGRPEALKTLFDGTFFRAPNPPPTPFLNRSGGFELDQAYIPFLARVYATEPHSPLFAFFHFLLFCLFTNRQLKGAFFDIHSVFLPASGPWDPPVLLLNFYFFFFLFALFQRHFIFSPFIAVLGYDAFGVPA